MKKTFLSLLIVGGLFFCTKSVAQNKIFIKAFGSTGAGSATGVFDGGSTSDRHRNEIEAYAYSDGLAGCANATKLGGGSACKVVKTPFSFSMPLSFAVISFKYNLLQGKFLTSVDMVINNNSGERGLDYYKVHMEGVQVTSVSEGASGEAPVFNIELQPQKIAWEITKQSTDGAAGDKFSYGWDFTANRPFAHTF